MEILVILFLYIGNYEYQRKILQGGFSEFDYIIWNFKLPVFDVMLMLLGN